MKNIYFVYVLLDRSIPGEYIYGNYEFPFKPFYVGKGHKSRHTAHLEHALWKKETGRTDFSACQKKIIKILARSSKKPKAVRVHKNLPECEAFNLERQLITLIGRKRLGTGPLVNVFGGGQGNSGAHMTHAEFLKRVRRLNSKPIEFLTKFKGAQKRITCLCRDCEHIWKPVAHTLYGEHGCPKCSKNHVRDNKRYQRELDEKYQGRISVVGEYQHSSVAVLHKCIPCNKKFYRTPRHTMRTSTLECCPSCQKSEVLARQAVRISSKGRIFQSKFIKLYGKKALLLSEYLNARTPLTIRYACCGLERTTLPHNLLVNMKAVGHSCTTKSKLH